MNYPSIKEYKEAILFAEDNFEQLKNLRPVLEDDGSPVMTSGNFAVVFKMKDEQSGKLHAVKCFLREQEGRAEAYRQIAEELEYVSSTFLTPIKYLEKELFVDTNASDDTEFPVLLMDWVEGETLDKYIRNHLDDQYELSLLAYQFSRLAMWLMPQPFAHGDLKPDNILVKRDGTLVLVDYDGMYVPAMKGQRARELGSPDFRHPSRTETDFDEHIDDFSLASILLSLKAIALQPSLLEEYGAQDRLLFSEKDYRNLSESKVMDALKPLMQDAELASLYSLFILAASQNNLSGVSFRLFYLNRPSVSSPKKSLRVLQINKKIVNQSDNKIIKKELLSTFQGKKNVWHIVASNGTSSYLTQERSFSDETYAKGACKLNTVENDTKHVLFLFNNRDAEVGRYYIGKKLQGLTPTQLTEIKNELCFFESWNPETKKWVPCVGKTKRETNKEENLSTEVTDEDLNNAWTDEFGVQYSKDRKRLLKAPDDIESYSIRNGTLIVCDSAFHGCYNLSQIIVPESVEYIGVNPFANCESLNDIVCKSKQYVFQYGALYSSDIKTIISCIYKGKDFYIPKGVNIIAKEAFSYCSNLIQISIPDTITMIGESAFSGCDSLKQVIIPNSVNMIGHSAFSCCHSLSIVEIPNSVTFIGEAAFWECPLTHVQIPDSITKIEKRVFEFCSSLSSIIIPNSVNHIGDNAFWGCSSLKQINLPYSISYIGKNVFGECNVLEKIVIPEGCFGMFQVLLPDYKDLLVEQDGEEVCLAFCSENSDACEGEDALWAVHAKIIKKDGKLGVVVDDGKSKKQIIPFIYDTWFDYDGYETEIRENFFDNYQDYIGYFAIKNADGTFTMHGYDKDGALNISFTCEKFNPDSYQLKGKWFLRYPTDGVAYDDIRRMGYYYGQLGNDNCYFALRKGNKWSLVSDDLKKTYIGFIECDEFKNIGWAPKGYYAILLKEEKYTLCIGKKDGQLLTLANEYDYIGMRYRMTNDGCQVEGLCFIIKNGEKRAVCSNDLQHISPFIFDEVGQMINDNEVKVTRKVNGKEYEFVYRIVNSNGWRYNGTRPFNPDEVAAVKRTEVVASQYGNSLCIFMQSGGQTYIPLSKYSTLTVGDSIDLKTAKLITLSRDGDDDIYRVIE